MSAPQIEDYRFGRIVVDAQVYTRDLIILPNCVVGDWWRQEGHKLLPEDLEPVLAAHPDLLIVGQGAFGRMRITSETRRALEEAGIEVTAQSTKQACETYNQLSPQQRVAAALHLSC
jgi:hypothetical protein